jgi:hypothetical protein
MIAHASNSFSPVNILTIPEATTSNFVTVPSLTTSSGLFYVLGSRSPSV